MQNKPEYTSVINTTHTVLHLHLKFSLEANTPKKMHFVMLVSKQKALDPIQLLQSADAGDANDKMPHRCLLTEKPIKENTACAAVIENELISSIK